MAQIYARFLTENGYKVTLIPIDNVLSTDFTSFDLTIIGYDTSDANNNEWERSSATAQHIATARRPVLGLSTGGALFFDVVEPSLGLKNGQALVWDRIYADDFQAQNFYTRPFNVIDVQRNSLLTLFDQSRVETVVIKPIYYQTPLPVGYADVPKDGLTIAAQDCHLLWGYSGLPSAMTQEGQGLFVNAVFNTMGRQCAPQPNQACLPIAQPADFPTESALINFDTLNDQAIPEGTDLSSLYKADFGVTFPPLNDAAGNSLNRVVATGDTAAPHSKPNIAFNSALNNDIGSDDVPLIIDFAEAKSHVGFYYGANDTLDLDATLTAYDASGQIICEVVRNSVPLGHSEFVGIQDPEAGIVRIQFDYGGSTISESIDDLIFAPYQAPEPPLPACEEITSVQNIPEPGQIFFDNINDIPIDPGTILTDFYADSHGVTFGQGPTSRVETRDNATPQSKLNVAFNALPAGSTANFSGPMGISFAEGKSHVGFYFGAFEPLADSAAVLTAFDKEGNPFCAVRRDSIPGGASEFIGIRDSDFRIARVELAYASRSGELIDDLHFSPKLEEKPEDPTDPEQRIHVCIQDSDGCKPAPNALLHRIVGGFELTSMLLISPTGDVINPAQVQPGDELWARVPVSATGPLSATSSLDLYYTSGLTPTVVPSDFGPTSTMTISVSADYPLLLQNIDMSTQWNLEGDPDYKAKLEANLHKASDYLYDFTNAQFTLGEITVNQNYDMWDDSAIWLHADNNQRPLALVGGMVDDLIPDVDASLNISYASGHIYMGSEWNRYYEPPGDPDITSTVNISDDWSLALGHEIGHYSLFQWDSYFGIFDTEDPDVKEVKPVTDCTGSAMGFVYFEENTEFIYDQEHWDTNCANTHAVQQVGDRTEWETIKAWYPWVNIPKADNVGPAKPPVELTNVNFVPPKNNNPTLKNQTFDLLYESIPATRTDAAIIKPGASDRARAYLIRDNRIIEQGQPAEGTRVMELTGATEGDRFCLFDVKNLTSQQTTLIGVEDEFDPKTASRHQFGCKTLAGDDGDDIEEYELDLERDVLWEPVIYVNYVTSKTINISVTMPISVTDISLKARVYPEHEATFVESDILVEMGETVDTKAFSTTVVMTDFTPSAYVQLWATEDPVTETDPRREAIIGSGTKGAVVPGPARWGSHAPIISPKGDFIILFNENINLGRGQFVAIQETFALPTLPANTTAVTDISSYRLTAFPQSLITSGVVSLRYLPPVTLPLNNQVDAANADAEMPDLTVYFWNGNEWEPLSTNVEVEPDGSFLASAPIGGAGTYALLRQIDELSTLLQPTLYLPVIQ